VKIALIAAMDLNRGIGYENSLPWHFKSDLAHFKKLTLGKTVIMGRKTFESLGRPLKGRENLVVSSGLKDGKDYKVVKSLEEGIKASKTDSFIIGGSPLFQEALDGDIVDEIYLTLILNNYLCDRFFAKVEWERYDLATEKTIIESGIPLIFLKGVKK